MTTRNDAKYAALGATYSGSLADMRDQWDATQTFTPTGQDGRYALFGGATYADGESDYWLGVFKIGGLPLLIDGQTINFGG